MMIRVATLPLQRTLAEGLQRSQAKLATTQLQLNSGKKANDLAGLGTEAVRTLSARSMLAQQTAQKDSAVRLGTTLALYDTNITDIDTATSELRQSILTAIGTGQTAGLQGTIEGSFSRFRSALNATDGSTPLFAGAQTGEPPFKPATLAETAGATAVTAFSNDDTRASSRVGQGIDLTYGVTASELGGGMLAAFRTMAEAGTIGNTPTAAQMDALKTAMGQIDAALPQVRTVNATNGQRQRQVETLEARAQDRADLLTGLISENEDADYGQISIDIEQQKTILTASYSVFQKLSGMSLANYL